MRQNTEDQMALVFLKFSTPATHSVCDSAQPNEILLTNLIQGKKNRRVKGTSLVEKLLQTLVMSVVSRNKFFGDSEPYYMYAYLLTRVLKILTDKLNSHSKITIFVSTGVIDGCFKLCFNQMLVE